MLNCIVPLLVCLAAPAVAKVELTETDVDLTLDNGLIRVVLLRANASIKSISKDGQELLDASNNPARGSGYVQIYPTGGYIGAKIDRVDIHRGDGQIDLGFIQDNLSLPFYMETHYVMREGVSGFYGYIVLRYNHAHFLNFVKNRNETTTDEKKRIKPDVQASVGQLNFCFWMDPKLFTMERVDDQRHRRLRAKSDPGEMIMDATFREPDGRLYTKYDYLFENFNHRVHGISGNGFGSWVMQGTGEHLGSGPMAQELSTEHAILLQHFCGSHLAPRSIDLSPAEDGWSKLGGPFLFYFNRGTDEAEMWWDAKRVADAFVDEGPYQWMTHDLYAKSRGTVTGRLRITDGTDPRGALVILAQPPSDTQPEWQRQSKGFMFWSRVAADGTFTIPKVRPDTYTAYILHDQQFGESRHDRITVVADQTTDVGELTWRPEVIGKAVWQIGTPDRSSAEYLLGADRSWGKWRAYAQYFPRDVEYVIGKSDPSRDWFYVHTVATRAGGEVYAPVWRVQFTLDHAPKGRAAIRLGIAGVRGEKDVGLALAMNDQAIGRRTYANDSAPTRSAPRGWYRESVFTFDASALKAGQNVLTLSLEPETIEISQGGYGKVPSAMLMYDAIRLEIDETGE